MTEPNRDKRDLRIVIIGAGMAGILSAIKFREAGYTNFFVLNGPNGPVGNFSLIRIAELQLGYIMQLVDKLGRGECRAISARRSAATDFETARAAAAKKSIWATGCKSWYLDKHGVPASWPWSRDRFDEEMAAPKFEAYDSVS